MEDHPQKTVLVWIGLNLPKDSHFIWSISGQTNFIPTYCPMSVPKINQKAEAPRYQMTIFLSSSGVWMFIKVLFFSSTTGLFGSCVTFVTTPLLDRKSVV